MSRVLKLKSRLVPTGPRRAWAFLNFPFDVVKTLGTRAGVAVCGTVNGFPFRSSLSPTGGQHVLCINKGMQTGVKVKVGDLARFVMQRDDQPLTVTAPLALKRTLAAKPKAKAIFDKPSSSHRKKYAQWIHEAKQEAAAKRRLKKLISRLLENQT
jgi:hypothetical protein